MSKDVVIAGVIVAACLGLVTVAFVVPRHKSKPSDTTSDTSIAANDTAPTDPNATDPSSLSLPPSIDNGSPLANNNATNPFATNPTTPGGTHAPSNPFAPVGPPLGNPNARPGASPTPSPFTTSPNFPVTTPPPLTIPEPTPVSTPTEAKTHVVASGETLGEISMKHYGTSKNWKKIAEANKVDPSDLKVGQKLTIPVLDKPAAPAAPAAEPVLASGERTYKVRKDDSYYTIAKRELGSASRWKEIEKLNSIPAEELRVGQTIKLPAKDSGAPSATPVAPGDAAPAASDGKTHVVAAGETLSDISKKYFGTTTKWKEIVKVNPGLDPEGMKVGQKIRLPDLPGAPAPTTGAAPAAGGGDSSGGMGEYTVKAGDTLETIAQSQLGSKTAWKKLVDANPGLDARKMRIGQKLKIPGKAPTTDAAPTAPPASNNGFGNSTGFGGGNGLGPSPTIPGGANYPAPGGYPAPAPGGAPAPNPFGAPAPGPGSTYPTPGGSSLPAPGGLPSGQPTGSTGFGGSDGFGGGNGSASSFGTPAPARPGSALTP
jgi:nucleoid-associated protein YgaU